MNDSSNNAPYVEKLWITPSGLLAIVAMASQGHRCGYVGVPEGHPLYGVGYAEETLALKRVPADAPFGQRSPLLALGLAIKGRIPRSPEVAFDVHGGITYANVINERLVKVTMHGEPLWWFGYDCAHCMDAPSPAHQAELRSRYPDKPYMWHEGGVHRTLEFCTDQCNSLAEQITTMTRSRLSIWLARVWAAFRRQPLKQER